MNINTTINISKKNLQLLNDLSDKLQISKNQLISSLLTELFKYKPKSIQIFRRVSYQERLGKKNWHSLHVSFRCDLYEKAHDFRKLCKRSVSSLIAFALSKYIDDIEKKLSDTNNTDNYTSQYVFMPIIHDNIEAYIIQYRVPTPEEYEQLKKLTKTQ